MFVCLFVFLLGQDLLLSNSEGSDSELSDSEQLQIMMELQYKRKKKWRKRLKRDPKVFHCTSDTNFSTICPLPPLHSPPSPPSPPSDTILFVAISSNIFDHYPSPLPYLSLLSPLPSPSLPSPSFLPTILVWFGTAMEVQVLQCRAAVATRPLS